MLPSLAEFIFKIKIKIKFETIKYTYTKNKTLDQFSKKMLDNFSSGNSIVSSVSALIKKNGILLTDFKLTKQVPDPRTISSSAIGDYYVH